MLHLLSLIPIVLMNFANLKCNVSMSISCLTLIQRCSNLLTLITRISRDIEMERQRDQMEESQNCCEIPPPHATVGKVGPRQMSQTLRYQSWHTSYLPSLDI